MKTSLYDRLESATTDELLRLRGLYIGIIEQREKTPRFDFHGKCVTRCTQILERRGVLPTASPIRRRRSSSSSTGRVRTKESQ